MPDIVVATRNPGKLTEIQTILDPGESGLRLLTLDDFPGIGEIRETGATFEENALMKAGAVEQFTGKIALADDSGLAVDALGGRPGVMSARFAGNGATDERNNLKLLSELKGLPIEQRGATFICVIAVAAGKAELLVRGECRGIILEEGRGSRGFGYDPIFFYPPMKKTYSEMTPEEKNAISHRAKALAELQQKFSAFMERTGT